MFRSSWDYDYNKPHSLSVKSAKMAKVTTKYQCEWCPDDPGWDSETEVDLHKQLQHNGEMEQRTKEENVCLSKPSNRRNMCLQAFESHTKLIQHVKEDHLFSSPEARRIEREIFICEHCNELFFNKLLLTVHIIICHSRGAYTCVCPSCRKRLRSSSLWSHFQQHRIPSVGSCPVCLAWCASAEKLKIHLNGHLKHYQCGICAFTTHKQHCFDRHVEKHSLGDVGSVPARVQRYFAPNRQGKANSTRGKPFKGLELSNNIKICILCREIFTDSRLMSQHIVHHQPKPSSSGEQRKKYLCRCGEKFFNGVLLKHHVFKLKGDHEVVDNETTLS